MPDGQVLPPPSPAEGTDDDPLPPQLGGVLEGLAPVLSPKMCSRILSAFWAAWEVGLRCSTIGGTQAPWHPRCVLGDWEACLYGCRMHASCMAGCVACQSSFTLRGQGSEPAARMTSKLDCCFDLHCKWINDKQCK